MTEIEPNIDNLKEDNPIIIEDGFEYPKSSMSYKNQQKGIDKNRYKEIRFQKKAGCSEDSTLTDNNKTIPVDPQYISVLIGFKGRNISLISRHASVFAAIENNCQINFVSKSEKSDHDLAHRMMISMVSGGVLRWFNHPSATNKYYNNTARAVLEQVVSDNSDCTLELLRAYNGHLCLIVVAKKDADKEKVGEQIKNIRAELLEKIILHACDPTTTTDL
jgi:hypothetical protein